jgi:hypothetical protein
MKFKQGILYGLFWIIWAECALLLHVFKYGSVVDMPAAPFSYVVLSPILIISAISCYFYPMQAVALRNAVLSICKCTRSDSPAQEQQPLLKEKSSVDKDACLDPTAEQR